MGGFPSGAGGNKPVAQAELNGAPAVPAAPQVGDDGGLALGVLAADHAGILAGLDQRALAGERLLPIDGRDDDRALPVLFFLSWSNRGSSSERMMGTTGRLYFLANSKSRWSPQGTAMTAPVP